MNEIQTKLLNIQSKLKAPKGQYNKFGKYNYRSCEDILEAVKPLCKDEGVILTISDSLENIGDRYYVKATATICFGDNCISVSAYAREEETKKGMDGAQITGAASSYARKYALNGLFAIDDSKDADSTNNSTNGNSEQITDAQAQEINALVEETGTDHEKVLIFAKVSSYNEMSVDTYQKVKAMLEAKK